MCLQTGKALPPGQKRCSTVKYSFTELEYQHSMPADLTQPVTACCGKAHMSGRGPSSGRSASWARPWSQAAWTFCTAAFVCAALGSAPLGIAWTLQAQLPQSGIDLAPAGSVGSGACHQQGCLKAKGQAFWLHKRQLCRAMLFDTAGVQRPALLHNPCFAALECQPGSTDARQRQPQALLMGRDAWSASCLSCRMWENRRKALYTSAMLCVVLM